MIFISITIFFVLKNTPKLAQIDCVREEKNLYLQNKLHFGDKTFECFQQVY